MEQKITRVSRQSLWSVYVFVERDVQEGRSITRRKQLGQIRPARYIPGVVKSVIHKFLYLNVTKMHKKENMLYIQVGTGKKKEVHRHDMNSVVSVQIREYRKDGIIE